MRIYARVVIGEIVVDCEAPAQRNSNGEMAIEMMHACADKAERLFKASQTQIETSTKKEKA